MSTQNIKCPKCASADNCYLFCQECSTYYCITCCQNYYEDNITKNIIPKHNPECNVEDTTPNIILDDLSDYEE